MQRVLKHLSGSGAPSQKGGVQPDVSAGFCTYMLFTGCVTSATCSVFEFPAVVELGFGWKVTCIINLCSSCIRPLTPSAPSLPQQLQTAGRFPSYWTSAAAAFYSRSDAGSVRPILMLISAHNKIIKCYSRKIGPFCLLLNWPFCCLCWSSVNIYTITNMIWLILSWLDFII